MRAGRLAAGAIALASCTSLDGLSGDAGSPTDSGRSPDAASPAPSDGAPPDAGSDVVLPPGTIVCAGTSVTCDITQSECCVDVTGHDSPPPRTIVNATARCGTIGGPNCGPSYGTVGADYSMSFNTRCASRSDCDAGDVCCASLAAPGYVGSIACVARAACDDAGALTLCSSTSPCTSGSCVRETDPVLAQLYEGACK